MAHRSCRNSEVAAAARVELRRRAAAAWRRKVEGRQRGNGEEKTGFIAMPLLD
jgi:hypothetical protein